MIHEVSNEPRNKGPLDCILSKLHIFTQVIFWVNTVQNHFNPGQLYLGMKVLVWSTYPNGINKKNYCQIHIHCWYKKMWNPHYRSTLVHITYCWGGWGEEKRGLVWQPNVVHFVSIRSGYIELVIWPQSRGRVCLCWKSLGYTMYMRILTLPRVTVVAINFIHFFLLPVFVQSTYQDVHDM